MPTAMPTMPREKRNDLAVKIDAYVLRLAKILAAHEDTTIAKILSETMRPILLRKLEKMGVPIPPPPPESERDDDDAD